MIIFMFRVYGQGGYKAGKSNLLDLKSKVEQKFISIDMFSPTFFTSNDLRGQMSMEVKGSLGLVF